MPRPSSHPSLASENAAPGGTAAVDRALSLLLAFNTSSSSVTLADLSTHTGLHKSTVLRLLASLQHADAVTRLSDGTYRLGPAIAKLHGIYTSSFSLGDIILPILQDLVNQTGESAALHVRQGEARVCLYRVDSPHPLRDHVNPGDVLPLIQGAGGHVLLAYNEPSHSRYQELSSQGFIIQHGDRVKGLSGISAPIINGARELVGAMTLTMPTDRFKEAFGPTVLAAANHASSKLGR